MNWHEAPEEELPQPYTMHIQVASGSYAEGERREEGLDQPKQSDIVGGQ
jgi:hypothetical protein